MRTGSSLLCSMLDSHSEIQCKLEVLHRKHYNGPAQNVEEYLTRLSEARTKPVFGFKIMYHQMWGFNTPGYRTIAEALTRNKVKIIHLIRPNYLDTFLSQLLASRSDVWNAFESRRIDKHFIMKQPDTIEKYNSAVQIDIGKFDEYCQRYSRWSDLIDRTFQSFRVTYERIQWSSEVLDFLGVPRQDLVGDTVKLRTQSKADLISNYQELASHLRYTKREWMLLG